MDKGNIFFVLFFLVSSCVHIRMDDSVDLGSNYRYIQDYPQTIIYHKEKKYNGVGQEVVPPLVQEYKFNGRFIIAKSRDIEADSLSFWIIDKKNQEVLKNLEREDYKVKFKQMYIPDSLYVQ